MYTLVCGLVLLLGTVLMAGLALRAERAAVVRGALCGRARKLLEDTVWRIMWITIGASLAMALDIAVRRSAPWRAELRFATVVLAVTAGLMWWRHMLWLRRL